MKSSRLLIKMKSCRKGFFLILQVTYCLISLLIALSIAQTIDGGDGDDDGECGEADGTPCCLAGTFLDQFTSTCKSCSPGCAICTDL